MYARAAGAKEVILYTEQNFLEEVKRITGGRGVNVVYDSVGKDTFDRSLESLAPLGMLVSCGQPSGFPAPLDIQRLGGCAQPLSRGRRSSRMLPNARSI
jgi:NADPH2:quinone reductase